MSRCQNYAADLLRLRLILLGGHVNHFGEGDALYECHTEHQSGHL
jgi:hypothetical protein